MNSYTITHVTDKPDWSSVPVLAMQTKYLQTQDNVKAFAQICYGSDALLLHLWAQVPEIRAVESGPIGVPCEDSCLEFFFQPVFGDPRYINLEFNFNGCFYLGMGTCIADLLRLIPDSDAEAIFAPVIRETDGGWEIFYQIPYDFIRRIFPEFEATPGSEIRANCYACSDLTQPHYYLSWNPVTEEPFTFHRSNCFGVMKFENY